MTIGPTRPFSQRGNRRRQETPKDRAEKAWEEFKTSDPFRAGRRENTQPVHDPERLIPSTSPYERIKQRRQRQGDQEQ